MPHCPYRRLAVTALTQFPPNTRDGMTLIRLQRQFVRQFLDPDALRQGHKKASPFSVTEHNDMRRRAIQMVSELPQNTAFAMMVLDYEEEFLLGFLDEGLEEETSSNVTAFSAAAKSR